MNPLQKSPTTHPKSQLLTSLGILAFSIALGSANFSYAADSKASKYYEDALIRYEKNDYPGTIIQLKNALQIDSKMLPVQVLLGKALLKNSEVVAAEVAFLEALRLGVNRAELLVPLAHAYIAQGKQKLLFELPTFSPIGLTPAMQMEVHLLRAAAHTDMGDIKSALKSIDEARAIDPKSGDSFAGEVPIRIRAHQYKEALEAAERAIVISPKLSSGWYQKGSVLHVSGDLRAAVVAYNEAIKLDGDNLEARVARAGINIDLKQFAETATDLAELQRIAPKEPRASYMRALLAERDGKPQEARAALKELVELIDPVPMSFIRFRPQLLMLNGLAHFGLGEREKAKIYLEAFQKAQGDAPTAKMLSQMYLRDSNPDRAIEVLEIYLKARPNDGQALALLGSALMNKGQTARAANLMQQALASKDTPEVRTVLGMSLLQSGQSASGIKELESAYKKDPRQTQAATALILQYLQTQQGSKAVALAESLVKQQPNNSGFLNLLGMAKGGVGNIAGSRAAFEQAIKGSETFVTPKLNLARLEIATKAFDAAKTRLNAILKTDPKNAEAMFELATLAGRTNQMAEAQRWLEAANDLSGPRETRWGLALSDFHLRAGRPGPALEAAKQVASRAPDDLPVLMTLARAQLANRDAAGVKASLTSATRVAEYNAAPQVQIALLQMSANNLAGAAYSLEKAIAGQSDFLPALALQTEVDLRQGDAAKAEKRARDIVAKSPKRAVGYSLLGDIAASKGQTAAALDSYRKAHQVEPSNDTLLRLFRALIAPDGGKGALQLGEQWVKTYPKAAQVHRALGDQYARSGSFTAAKSAYENVLKVAPDEGDTLNNLANVLILLKDPGALKVAEQALATAPANPNFLDTVGWALHLTGQTDRALQVLRDARLRDPANSEIRYHLAVVLVKSGRTKEAREELEAALKGAPAFESSVNATNLLASLR